MAGSWPNKHWLKEGTLQGNWPWGVQQPGPWRGGGGGVGAHIDAHIDAHTHARTLVPVGGRVRPVLAHWIQLS